MHHRIYAGAATACAVAIDVECEIADEVHVAGKDAECFRQPLADFRIAAGNAARGAIVDMRIRREDRSEEHTSELQSLMRISYAVFCLKKKNERSTILDKAK